MNNIKLSIVTFLVLLAFSGFASAETIELNDGSILVGKVLETKPEYIKIETMVGQLKIDREKIRRIDFDNAPAKKSTGALAKSDIGEGPAGTVRDKANGLLWQKEADNVYRSYSEGRSYCQQLELGGKTDWRLPTVDELRTLVNDCPNTTIGGGCQVSDGKHGDFRTDICSGCGPRGKGYLSGFLGGSPEYYWSSSFFEASFGRVYAWSVNFSTAEVQYYLQYYKYLVRCVRSEK